jgi:hypothetical protein
MSKFSRSFTFAVKAVDAVRPFSSNGPLGVFPRDCSIVQKFASRAFIVY